MVDSGEQIMTGETSLRRKVTSKSPASQIIQQQFGKLPPQAVDLEEAVLGALMLEKDALTSVIDILHPDSFYKDAHQKVFNAIRRLFEHSEPIDILTVTQELRKKIG